jgi:hypothetical protein
MEINTLECGAKQIIMEPTDNFEILFQNESEKAIFTVFSQDRGYTFVKIGYEEGLRTERKIISVKTEE